MTLYIHTIESDAYGWVATAHAEDHTLGTAPAHAPTRTGAVRLAAAAARRGEWCDDAPVCSGGRWSTVRG